MSLRMPITKPTRPEPQHLKLEDLGDYSFAGTSLAVVGYPIGHSLSPLMHGAALDYIAQENPEFQEWVYQRIEAPAERLGEVIDICREKGFRGLNLTIPHKEVVLKYIPPSERVKKMGAGNTVIFGEHDSVENTDGFGMQHALKHDLGVELKGAEIVLMGAGGAARAAAVQCLESGCSKLWIANRSKERLQKLITDLTALQSGSSVIEPLMFEDFANPAWSESSLLVNATSIGLNVEDTLPFQPESMRSFTAVFDMVYKAQDTLMVRHAKSMGVNAADGLSMLAYQGVKSLSYWAALNDNQFAQVSDIMLRVLKDAIGRK